MSVPLLMMNNSGDILQRTYIAMLPEIESTVSQCVASHKYLNLCTWYSDSWPREWIETHPARTQTCSPLSSPLDAPTTLLHSLFHYGRHITNNYRNFFKVKQDTDSRSFIHSMLVLSSFYDCPCVCYFISILIKVCQYVCHVFQRTSPALCYEPDFIWKVQYTHIRLNIFIFQDYCHVHHVYPLWKVIQSETKTKKRSRQLYSSNNTHPGHVLRKKYMYALHIPVHVVPLYT